MKKFKAESQKVLDLMINSIYTNKEIFLRELLSNASDAIDKLYFKSLQTGNTGMSRSDFWIELKADKEARTLTITDNGIGMTEEELNSLRKKMAGTDTGDEAKGFGVSNVNQRIKYYYGEEYGVFFESKENEGTNATIIIAAKNIQLLS